MWYIRTRQAGGEEIRFPLDDKVKLVHEGIEYEAVGMTIDMYDSNWQVIDGLQGDEIPIKGLVVRDTFTFSKVELPLPEEVCRRIAAALLAGWGRRRPRLRGRVSP